MNLLKRRNTLTPLLGLYARRDSLQDCGENVDPILFSGSKSSRSNVLGHQKPATLSQIAKHIPIR